MKKDIDELVRLVTQGCTTRGEGLRKRALWGALGPGEQKQAAESVAFVSFVEATGVAADPFDHSNEEVPRPDICTWVDGSDHYFELGEITDEGLAKSISDSVKMKIVSGCALSQVEPLLKMLVQKCQKKYETGGAPVDLLLYYWRQHPYEDAINDCLAENEADINSRFLSSQFKNIWIYDMDSRTVLWRAKR